MMNTGEIILSVAGIVFGGGMLGQLIIFFIKRHDEKKKKRIESYRDFYDKLSTYFNDISRFLLDFFNDRDVCVLMCEDKTTETEQRKAEVDNLLKQIKKLKRGCGRNGCIDINRENCIACSNARRQLLETYELLQQNLEETRLLLQHYKSYWKENKGTIKELIYKNINLHNCLLASGRKERNLTKAVGEIDTLSLQIFSSILEEQNNEQKCLSLLTNQMSKIEITLHFLAKKIKI